MSQDSVIPADRESRSANAPASAGDVIVSVRDATKYFGPLKVLDGVSLEVRQGQLVAIVGRSGSGKSTLLRCMNGLEAIQGGQIVICGHDVSAIKSNRAELRRDVGMVFQSYNLFPHFTVERNITLALTLVKKKTRPKRQRHRGSRCWRWSDWRTKARPIPNNCRAASSSGWRSRDRWRCRRRSCCSTKSPRRWIPN